MKIKFSPVEYYNLEIPEEVEPDQLEGLILRLKAISRIKTDLGIQVATPVVHKVRKWGEGIKGLNKTKEQAIATIVELKKLGNQAMAEKYGERVANVQNAKSYFVKKFNLVKGVDYDIVN